MKKTIEEKARDKFRRSLSYNGDSSLYDGEFSTWWNAHAADFPGIAEDAACLIWTAGYDDGVEWGKDVMREYD